MKNLTPEQKAAFARIYRAGNHTRLYRSQRFPDGTYRLRAVNELYEEVGQAVLRGAFVTIDWFDASVDPSFTTIAAFKTCIVATLNAYRHADRPLADSFELADEPTITSLPMLTPDVLAA